MDKIIYEQDGITLTEREVLDAMPSPIQVPPLRDGETAKDQFDKLFETIKLALIARKAKVKIKELEDCYHESGEVLASTHMANSRRAAEIDTLQSQLAEKDKQIEELEKLNPLQKYMDDHADWADIKFKGQALSGVLNHLKKEVKELIDSPYDESEFADCFSLLLRAWRIIGGTADSAIATARAKLEICKTRTYGKPDADGSVQHIPAALKGGSDE